MCGITGVASRAPVDEPGQRRLERQRDCLVHRGPDDAGVWWSEDARVGLGHRRLSIIDLSQLGHQPMTSSDGQVVLVLNGELYNFRDLRSTLESRGHAFRSASDTEVLLAAYLEWGNDCLSRLDGMFAFAIYDHRHRRLLLARDRAGEKPLFYHVDGQRLVFGSELKSLLLDPAVPRRVDRVALDHYLAYGFVPQRHCMLEGVAKVAQGEAVVFDVPSGEVRRWRYWNLPLPNSADQRSDRELVDELEVLLEGAVGRQLVADVPVGILLSGGIDSSLVVAMAARRMDTVHTFTVSFPGHAGHDEAPYARLVADHFGTRHTELVAEPTSLELLPTLARQFDEPIADSSMIPTYLVSRLIRRHATVALGGDGGDELFGGYLHHVWIQREARRRRRVPIAIRRAIGLGARHLLPAHARGRNYLSDFDRPSAAATAHVNLYFDADWRRALIASTGRAPERLRNEVGAERESILQQITANDFQSYMVDDVLTKVDRASMLASLEVRAPWLDRSIIEFAFSRVPDRLRATESERKILPRMLARRVLPPALDLDRKQGFSIPLDKWMSDAWGDYAQTVLLDSPDSPFRRDAVRSLFDLHRRGTGQEHRIFALMMFELWRREYGIAAPDGHPIGRAMNSSSEAAIGSSS
jgi:asparagine synthase (glutamine-hydrolysing)